MTAWLTVIGLGEDGLDGISPAARALIDGAELLVGGERHLSKVPDNGTERLSWKGGFHEQVVVLEKHKGKRVVVLASGDPFCYGVGSVLARHYEADEIFTVPAPGAFSLAASRMGWSLPDLESLTIHGRPLETLNRFLFSGLRLLVLSRDGDSPAEVAALLTARGFGPSSITVLEHLGGDLENRLDGTASDWKHKRAADLNTLAIDCRAEAGATLYPRVPGLPEKAFEHDGQITKREVRAATLSALRPMPGQLLWDIGAGSGSVAIEWLRAERMAGATAVERNPVRAAAIARNALNLGVPHLNIVEGDAPEAFEDLEGTPDAVFLGGGVSQANLLPACWERLGPGGRLVANAVTIEAGEHLLAFRRAVGGALTRISVERAGPVGSLSGFKPLMAVTQLAVIKP